MKLGWLLLVSGMMVAGGVVWTLAKSEREAPPAEARPPYVLPVTLGKIEQGTLRPSVKLTGSVRTQRAVELSFLIAGRIDTLHVQEGDWVEPGAVLGVLDKRDLELRASEARASLQKSELELKQLEAGERDEEKRRLAAELDAAKADEELARIDVERGRTLRDADVGTQANLDRLQSEHAAATARTAAARARHDLALAGTRAEDLAVARAEVAVARATLDRALGDVEKCTLRATWRGSVQKKLADVGDFVERGDGVLAVLDLAAREIEVELPSRHAEHIQAGVAVTIEVDELPGSALQARLSAKLAGADELTRNVRALIRLDTANDPHSVLRPGMFVRLSIALAPLENALLVHSDAVCIKDTGAIIVRAKPNAPSAAAAQPGPPPPPFSAEWVPVRVLATDGASSAIESLGAPLAGGESIVLTGVDIAFPGAPLLPRAEPPTGEAASGAGGR